MPSRQPSWLGRRVTTRLGTFDAYVDVKFFLERALGRKIDLVLADAVKPRLRPMILAEFEDSALLKAFAQSTGAVFAAPSLVRRSITEAYGVQEVGTLKGIRERFFAISLERKVRNAAVARLLEAAHRAVNER